jgi:hypothetical protein
MENVTMKYGIQDEDWDIIFIQQGAEQAGRIETYGDYLDSVLAYVNTKKQNPNAQFVWNMTWAYANDYSSMQKNGYSNQISMYNLIANAVETKIATNMNFVAISPAGTAVQNARTSILGDTLNRDGTHLTYDVGRYIAAMSMFCSLTGYAVDDITYVPGGLDEARISIAKDSVRNALANKYEVTPFKN